MNIINYGRQYIDQDDIDSVVDVLKSDYLTSGPKVEEFEKLISEYTGYKYTKCVSSGTAALHSACFAAGICFGDEVIVPSITFIATANAVVYQGGTPVFADIDKDTLLIDIESVKKRITKKTKAIICVDFAGQLCDYKALKKICKDNNLILIADSCHAFGAINSLAKNQIPDFICYSFHPVKHITTGEGGAVCCNNFLYYDKINSFANHGRPGKNSLYANNIGYNYRMSDISAALGISQYKKQIEFIKRRYEIANKYKKELNAGLKKVNIHVYHLYVIKVEDRNYFIRELIKYGIRCGIHYIPVYEHPFYNCIESAANCPNTENVKGDILSLPIFYGLTDNQQNFIIEKIKNIYS